MKREENVKRNKMGGRQRAKGNGAKIMFLKN